MKFTTQQRRTANGRLSQEVQNFASSDDVLDLVVSIGNKYKLSEEQIDEIDSEVYVTMLELQNQRELELNIDKIINNKEMSVGIVKELNDAVFSKLDTLKTEVMKNTEVPDTKIEANTPNVPEKSEMVSIQISKEEASVVRGGLRGTPAQNSLADIAQQIASTNL